VQTQDWPHGATPSWFADFSAAFAVEPVRTLERFASLHLAGVGNERGLLRRLRAMLAEHEPAVPALAVALKLLGEGDLRAAVSALRVPGLIVHGACDQVVPPAAGKWLAHAMPSAQWVEIADAGHAPFLSHHDIVLEKVRAFLHD
jgi:pimeloyl-[acyl-carrier protein] methyl ester esterase